MKIYDIITGFSGGTPIWANARILAAGAEEAIIAASLLGLPCADVAELIETYR